MHKRLGIAALATLIVSTAGAILIPRLRRTEHYQGSATFLLPIGNPKGFSEYLGRLATFQAPSPRARPIGYVHIARSKRIAIYLVRNGDTDSPVPR